MRWTTVFLKKIISDHSIVFLHGKPLLREEIELLHRVQVANNQVFQKPRGRWSSAAVVMPEMNVVQRSQRSTIEGGGIVSDHGEQKKFTLLRYRENKRIDRTTLKDLSMRISKDAHRCFIRITRDQEMNLERSSAKRDSHEWAHFRLGPGVSSMSGEDEDLIIVLIIRMIVR